MLKKTIFALAIAIMPLAALASGQPEFYSKWDRLSTEQLITSYNRFLMGETMKTDSALVCLNIVTDRLEQTKDTDKRRDLCEAYMTLWQVYFFYFFNYDKSFFYLSKAKNASSGMNDMEMRVNLCYGNIYQTLSEQWGDMDFARKAITYYEQAFIQGCKAGNREIANLTFSNLIPMKWKQGSTEDMKKMLRPYKECMAKGKRNTDIEYSDLLYDGFLALSEQRNDDALKAFSRQAKILDNSIRVFRMKFNAYENIALAFSCAGKYEEAVTTMKTAEKMAEKYDLKDGKLEVYKLMQEYLRKAGHSNTADSYMRKYYMLKDSMQNYQRIMGVGELEFQGKIDDANRQVREIRLHQRRIMLGLAIVACFSAVISISLVMVSRKNRALRQANRMLYKKNTELQSAEDELLRIQKENTVANDTADNDNTTEKESEKKRNDNLTEEEKTILINSIVDVMAGCNEIYSHEFTVARLAELAGSNSKTVSRIIKEKTGGNFNTILNDYRIREACRRISSCDYDNYTIEALSNNVGFRSRTTFITSFKHFTGLTPSEYIRIAKESNQKQNV